MVKRRPTRGQHLPTPERFLTRRKGDFSTTGTTANKRPRSGGSPRVRFGRLSAGPGPDDVELLHHVGVELHLLRRDSVVELLHGAGSDNRRGHPWHIQ